MTISRPPTATPFIVVSPLWARAPSRDEKGRPYFDFMMLIPGLKQQDQLATDHIMIKLKKSLKAFENVVVYVDLNTRLGLLWISIKPVPQVTQRIVHAIQYEIPGAKVVAGDFNPESFRGRPTRQPLLTKMKSRINRAFRFSLRLK